MQNVQQLTQHVYWIGGNDFTTPRFENAIPLPKGISYNSYFIDDEKTAVIDATDTVIRDQFLENVEYVLQGRSLDYIIVNHMEPDHSGSLLALLERHSEAKLVASPAAIKMFEQFFHLSLADRYIRVNERLEIDLGTHKLKFLTAPMVHWPEVTFTYESTEKILFSADAFGTFGVMHGTVFVDDSSYEEEYLAEMRRYYANIVGKFGMQTKNAIKKVETLEVEMLCTLHGPVLRGKEQLQKALERVKGWAAWEPEMPSVTLLFASAYGNTALATQRLAWLLSEKGVKNMKLVDLCSTDVSDAWAEIYRRSHVVLAAPTVNMGLHPKMRDFLATCTDMGVENRKVSILGNSSWAPHVAERLMHTIVDGWKQCEVIGEDVFVSSAVGEEEEKTLTALATAIAESVLGE